MKISGAAYHSIIDSYGFVKLINDYKCRVHIDWSFDKLGNFYRIEFKDPRMQTIFILNFGKYL